jgi:uncharacterized protein (TIGR03382 family)
MPTCCRALLLMLCLLAPASSRATPNFPGAIQRELQLARAPDCSLCHVGPQQVGTVNTPFGRSMRSRGLVFYDEASLRRALSALRAERIDSDGDGTPDIDELVAGGDPNAPSGGGGGGEPGDGGTGGGGGGGGQEPVPPAPTYGCGAAGSAGTFLLLALLLPVLLRRRRRPAPGYS